MIKKVIIGIITGTLIGMFVTSMFVPKETLFTELILTKITATSIVTAIICGIYAHLSKSKLQIFLISILIGMVVFYLKYLITGHHFEPLTMGAFVGAMLGGTFAVLKKLKHSLKTYNRLQRLRKRRL
jgi:hypothetical protein